MQDMVRRRPLPLRALPLRALPLRALPLRAGQHSSSCEQGNKAGRGCCFLPVTVLGPLSLWRAAAMPPLTRSRAPSPWRWTRTRCACSLRAHCIPTLAHTVVHRGRCRVPCAVVHARRTWLRGLARQAGQSLWGSARSRPGAACLPVH